MKGIIFDFNGTLFWDSQLHLDVWREYSKKLRGTPFTDDEMFKYMFGRTNEDIIEYAIGQKPDKALVEKFANEKEAEYRTMCLKRPQDLKLAPHAEEFLNFLKAHHIPRTIATMSEWCNVEFYIEQFHLEKWFDLEKIVYSDGKIPGKPAPDIYLIAAQNLGLNPGECIVIEDALSGIQAAKSAGIGKIIAIASREPVEFYKDVEGVSQIITDFSMIDRNSFQI